MTGFFVFEAILDFRDHPSKVLKVAKVAKGFESREGREGFFCSDA